MIIDIRFYGNEIDFLEKDKIIYNSSYTVSWFKHIKKLFNQKNEVVCNIKTKVNFSGIKHILNFNDISVELKLKGKLSKNYFESFYKGKFYRAIIHKGHKVSIFENKNQIAYYVKDSKLSFSYKNFKLISNSNINKDFIFSVISALELSSDPDEGLVVDFGNIAGEYKPFDEKWKPTI